MAAMFLSSRTTSNNNDGEGTLSKKPVFKLFVVML